MTPKVVQTARLTLVALEKDHLEAYYTVCSDHDASSWSLIGRRVSMEDAANYFPRILRNQNAGILSCWAVYESGHLEQKDCIGQVNLIPAKRAAREGFVTWELGYSLRGKFWGKGYATEAVTAAIAKLGEDFQALQDGKQNKEQGKLVAWVGLENEPSLKVLKKVGFEIVQCLKFGGKEWWLGGAWREDAVYVLETML